MVKYWLFFSTIKNFELAKTQGLWALKMSSINKRNWDNISKGDIGFFSLSNRSILGYGEIDLNEIRRDGVFKNYPLTIKFSHIKVDRVETIIKDDLDFIGKNRKGGVLNISEYGERLLSKLISDKEIIKSSTIETENKVLITKPLEYGDIEKIKSEVRALVRKGLFEDALEHNDLAKYLSMTDKDLYNEIIIQIGFIKNLKRSARTGVMSNDEGLLQQRKLMHSLLDLIERIE